MKKKTLDLNLKSVDRRKSEKKTPRSEVDRRWPALTDRRQGRFLADYDRQAPIFTDLWMILTNFDQKRQVSPKCQILWRWTTEIRHGAAISAAMADFYNTDENTKGALQILFLPVWEYLTV